MHALSVAVAYAACSLSVLAMLRTSFSVRQRAFLALTIALGLAYLLAALGLARPSQIADFGWPSRFNLGSSLVLVLGVLYGGAAWAAGGQ